jgi:hypothetical protein
VRRCRGVVKWMRAPVLNSNVTVFPGWQVNDNAPGKKEENEAIQNAKDILTIVENVTSGKQGDITMSVAYVCRQFD